MYTLFVLRSLTTTTQFQFHLHTVCVVPYEQHNTIPILCTHFLCCFLWPTQHNSNFFLHTVCVASFDQHNTIPVSSYTVYVLRPLTNTTQFQFHLHTVCVAPYDQHNTIPILSTHCLCCVLWPTQHNSNFILHTLCVASFDRHNTIPILSIHCLCCVLWPTQHNSNFIYTLFVLCIMNNTTQFQFYVHTVCVASFDRHNTIPVSSYTLFVLRPLTNTTQFQFHLHTGCVASFDQHNTIPSSSYTLFVLHSLTNNTIPVSSTRFVCCALWPTQHNFSFILHTVCVAPFDPKNTISVLTYTLFVLRPLTNTTQFQFYLTHCLCCALWPRKHNFSFNLHSACVAPFDQHNTIPVLSYALFVLRPLTQKTQFQF